MSQVIPLRTRDADRTQQEILRAATTEFAALGLGGARIDNIAERAGINKRLIYYYFASKDELFLAVLEQTYADIRQAERALHLEATTPVDALRKLVAFTWDHYLAHPEFLNLLNSENLHRARHLKQSVRIREMNSPLIETLGDVLDRGRREGLFRGGVDPCAAVHLDCRLGLLLLVQQPHPVSHIRAQFDVTQGLVRTLVAHHGSGDGLCLDRMKTLLILRLVNCVHTLTVQTQ